MPLMSDEIRQVPAGEVDADEVWQRLTDEPDVRDIEAWTDDEVDGWVVEVNVQEFFRDDPLGRELRDRLKGAFLGVEGVSQAEEYDNESWLVSGDPSGRDLTRAAAAVVDELAERLRSGMLGP
jgi:hypothetical protein